MSIKQALIIIWFPMAVSITVLFGSVYVIVQQSYRQMANDPQIQLAEDTASEIANGQPIASLIPEKKVNMEQSLRPFLIVYDSNGNVTAGNARLHNTLPTLPSGVFISVRDNGEERITWEPASGVRIAAVIVPYMGISSGYVLAGRSLREIEQRENNLSLQVGVSWALLVLISFFTVIFLSSMSGLTIKTQAKTKKK